MSKTGTAEVSNQVSNLLTFEELVDERLSELVRIEIPERSKDGQPGVVFAKGLSTRVCLEYWDLPAAEQKGKMPGLIAQAICDKDGNKMFKDAESVERLKDADIRIFTRLSQAVIGTMSTEDKDKAGKDSAATGSLPTV